MSRCKECETESPDELGPLREWLVRQEQRRWIDEIVYGSAFTCAACGARLDPSEIVIEYDLDNSTNCRER